MKWAVKDKLVQVTSGEYLHYFGEYLQLLILIVEILEHRPQTFFKDISTDKRENLVLIRYWSYLYIL